jgi:hypothetical protein
MKEHELLGCYANVWIRQKLFTEVGQTIGGHKHKYDHVSLLATGSAKVEVDGKEKIFHAPTFIVIRKDKVHNVTALEENTTWYCVFANRDLDGEVYDPEKNCPLDEDCHNVMTIENRIKINDITIEEA